MRVIAGQERDSAGIHSRIRNLGWGSTGRFGEDGHIVILQAWDLHERLVHCAELINPRTNGLCSLWTVVHVAFDLERTLVLLVAVLAAMGVAGPCPFRKIPLGFGAL